MADQTTTPSGEVATSYTEDQAAEELLKRYGGDDGDDQSSDDTSQDADDTGDHDDDSQADEATSDDSDDGADDGADESGEVEIDVAGEKFKLPAALKEHAERIQAKAKEVEAGATRKFQEAADLRKAAELTAEQANQQHQFNQAASQLLGDHALVTRRMQLIEQANTNDMDPVQLTRLNAEYNQLRAAKERIEAGYQRAQGLFKKDQDEIKQKRYQAAAEFAKANIKDFATDGGKRHAAYAARIGITPDEVENLLTMNPRLMLLLDDAEFGSRVRAAKPTHTKRIAEKTRTLKPGVGGQSQTSASAQVEKFTARARKSGSIDDITNALLAKSQAQKRRR